MQKQVCISMAHPRAQGQGPKPFFTFESDLVTQGFFTWMRDNLIDHSVSYVMDENGVDQAMLVVRVNVETYESWSEFWEKVVDENVSYWFNTETFVTVSTEDVEPEPNETP